MNSSNEDKHDNVGESAEHSSQPVQDGGHGRSGSVAFIGLHFACGFAYPTLLLICEIGAIRWLGGPSGFIDTNSSSYLFRERVGSVLGSSWGALLMMFFIIGAPPAIAHYLKGKDDSAYRGACLGILFSVLLFVGLYAVYPWAITGR